MTIRTTLRLEQYGADTWLVQIQHGPINERICDDAELVIIWLKAFPKHFECDNLINNFIHEALKLIKGE